MPQKENFIDPYTGYKELTLRGVILGFIITLVFTASNIYLGLKVGLTVASSIPAAVLAMAILKFAKGSNVLEYNMVQTQASAAGTLSAVVFVIPALLMMGYWQHFPFWQITLLCLCGGILGVIFTVPLRRVMVLNSPLPYPEGIAAAEILKAGANGRVANEHGEIIQDDRHPSTSSNHIKEILFGSVFAGVVSFLTNGLRIFADSTSFWLKQGNSIFQFPLGFSFALLGAGSLIGITAGFSIFLGLIFSWWVAVPYLSHLQPTPDHLEIAAYAKQLWTQKVRLIGVGTIGISALWTLILLFKPMCQGVHLSISALKNKTDNTVFHRTERDLNPKALLLLFATVIVILIFVLKNFISALDISISLAWFIVFIVTVLTVLIGFLVATASGYMAGLIGSSSSPISGITILAVIIFSVVLLFIGYSQQLTDTESGIQFLTALALFGSAVVLAISAIAHDNLQDLKTGYLIYATPAKQQIALIIGTIAGSLVIAPVLELLFQAYGFTGALPRPNMDPDQVLAAPQATLMAMISQGIFSHQLQWNYIFTGIGLGIGLIVLDFILRRTSQQKYSVQALAVGLGIYLPPTVSMPLFMGALIFWLIQKSIQKSSHNDPSRLKLFEQKSTLIAAGLIVGESIIGVVLAIIIVLSTSLGGSDAPLAIDISELLSKWFGVIIFILGIFLIIKRSTSN